ncbi:MAG: hypothetical protein RLZZ418_862 [Pseudomonadota bacterium]|jgi:hypothetical protein
MAKANNTSFKKGQVANPNGRGKGTLNKLTIERTKFQSLASEKYKEAFDVLWNNLEIGEGWAHQIYFNKLLPKKMYQPTVLVKQEEGQDRLEAVTAALSGFTELTHEEVMEEIKVFKNVEEKEEIKEQGTSILELLDGDKIDQIYKWLEEAKQKKIDS